MRTSRRPIILAAAVAAATLSLGACSQTNFSAQTNQQYQPGIGANLRGDVDVLNTLLVANPDGSATLSAGLVNQTDGDESITGVTVATTDGTALVVSSPGADPTLPSKQIVSVGAAGGDGLFVVKGAPVGRYVKVTISFTSAPPAVIDAPVVSRGESYSDIATP